MQLKLVKLRRMYYVRSWSGMMGEKRRNLHLRVYVRLPLPLFETRLR